MNTIRCIDYKIGLLALKYIPIIMFLIMWIHTGLLIFSISGPCADTIAGSAIIPSILILAISQMFKFCYIHKMLTIYSLVVDFCINFQRYIGFGIILYPMRVLLFIIGIIVFILLVTKFNKYRYKCLIIKE